MTIELESVSYGVLHVAGGQVRDRVPQARAYLPTARLGRRAARDAIYMLVDPEGPAPPDLLNDLLTVLEDAYAQHPSRSVTSALVGVIKAANDYLYRQNLNTVLTSRLAASICCVVLRGRDVYVGWAGQAPIYILHEGVLQRVPAEPDPADDLNRLGLNDSVEARLFHTTLTAGDVVLLCSTSLERIATPGQLKTALHQESLSELRARLIALAGEAELTTVMIRLKEAPVAASEPRPTGRRVGLGRLKDQPASRRPVVSPPPAVRSVPAPARQPDRYTPARPAAPTRRISWPWLLLPLVVALLAILGVAGAWFALSQWQENQAREAHFASLLVQAEQLRSQASTQPDRTARVQTLRQAQALVDEALTIKPDHKEAVRLRQAIITDLKRASLVTPLYGSIQLTDFKTAGSRVTQLWVQEKRVYVLDAGRGILYRYFLNENRDNLLPQARPDLLQSGQTVGDRVVGNLGFIFWMPAGGDRQEGILALDQNNRLFGEAGSDQIVAYDVGYSSQWGRVVAGGGYAGNLYLLDAGKNQIHKYLPTAGGYAGPATDYLQTPVDLSAAVDMAIDGNIYVLLASGEVLKFLRGERQPFPMTGLDTPLKDPRAIFCTEDVESVYVVDAAERRIVQFSKEGSFQRQLQYGGTESPALFADLRDISVVEGEKLARIYVLAGNQLVVFPLPPLGEEPLELPASE